MQSILVSNHKIIDLELCRGSESQCIKRTSAPSKSFLLVKRWVHQSIVKSVIETGMGTLQWHTLEAWHLTNSNIKHNSLPTTEHKTAVDNTNATKTLQNLNTLSTHSLYVTTVPCKIKHIHNITHSFGNFAKTMSYITREGVLVLLPSSC